MQDETTLTIEPKNKPRTITCTCGEVWEIVGDEPVLLNVPSCLVCRAIKSAPRSELSNW